MYELQHKCTHCLYQDDSKMCKQCRRAYCKYDDEYALCSDLYEAEDIKDWRGNVLRQDDVVHLFGYLPSFGIVRHDDYRIPYIEISTRQESFKLQLDEPTIENYRITRIASLREV